MRDYLTIGHDMKYCSGNMILPGIYDVYYHLTMKSHFRQICMIIIVFGKNYKYHWWYDLNSICNYMYVYYSCNSMSTLIYNCVNKRYQNSYNDTYYLTLALLDTAATTLLAKFG